MTASTVAPTSAFGVHNVRLYVAGIGVSMVGTFFQVVAVSLFVLHLTGSGFALGAIMGIQALPILFFGPWAGVLVDRLPLRRVLAITSTLAGIEAFALGLLISVDIVSIWWILGLSLFLGFVQAVDQPAGQAILSELVPPEQLPSAIALAGSIRSVGRLGGPAIAALLYAAAGPAWCFYVNAASYGAVVLAVVLMREREMIPRSRIARARGQLHEGIRYAWGSPVLRSGLLANVLVGCLAFNFPLFYASLVKDSFHAGSVWFGVAESLNAVTAVGGGLILARSMSGASSRRFAIASLALGSSLLWSALSPGLGVFLIGMLYFGAAVVFYQVAGQSLIQRNTPPQFVGRIMSLYTLGTMGTTPIGALIAGLLIDGVSPRAALGLGAASCFFSGACLLALRPANVLRTEIAQRTA